MLEIPLVAETCRPWEKKGRLGRAAPEGHPGPDLEVRLLEPRSELEVVREVIFRDPRVAAERPLELTARVRLFARQAWFASRCGAP